MRAADLGRIMHLEESQAERLLALLNVEDFLRRRVTDDGDLVYSAQQPRLRVDAGSSEAAADRQELADSGQSEAQLEARTTQRRES